MSKEYIVPKYLINKEAEALQTKCQHCKTLASGKGTPWCEMCGKVYMNRHGYHRLTKRKG